MSGHFKDPVQFRIVRTEPRPDRNVRELMCGTDAVISGLAANTRGLLSFPLVGTSTFRELYLIRPRGRTLPAMAQSFCDLVIAGTR